MKKQVLVIEDCLDTSIIWQQYLEQAGYAVTICSDGLLGLECARNLLPDIVVLDRLLPSMAGDKICRILKFDRNYEDIKILFCSALSRTEDLSALDADGYLTKPVSGNTLVSTVQMLLGDTKKETK
jgi:DNA-binding response OmpR family regulator